MSYTLANETCQGKRGIWAFASTVIISCFPRIVLGEPDEIFMASTQTHLAGKLLFVMLAICIKHAAPVKQYSCSFYIKINFFRFIVV